MKAADEYRAKAEEMRKLALAAETPEQAQGYRELAKTWLEMAEVAEKVQAANKSKPGRW